MAYASGGGGIHIYLRGLICSKKIKDDDILKTTSASLAHVPQRQTKRAKKASFMLVNTICGMATSVKADNICRL